MPSLAGNDGDGMVTQAIPGSNFTFQAARIGSLGATNYTLVTIVIDVTESTTDFADELRQALLKVIEACQQSPRADNLLVRVVTFSTQFPDGVHEVHGFTPLNQIDPQSYERFNPKGMTPLYDAMYNAIGAMVAYGGELMDQDYMANGIVIGITDGFDNRSVMTPAMIARQLGDCRSEERLESVIAVLVGINATRFASYLTAFKDEAGLDHYIDAGDATPAAIARFAEFVSASISSQSQALGTGGPSQAISATI